MIGIYRITNLINGCSYIGQSKNIERRIVDHITPSHVSEVIDRDITLLSKESFAFEVLEECTLDELDERERFYIDFYETDTLGYNKLSGGQGSGTRCGENNGNAKLTEDDVFNIREAYNNHERRKDVYKQYEHIVSKDTFNSLWQGQYWKTVHMDVYTEENMRYYKRLAFSDDEVIDIRNRYSQGESIETILEDFKDRISLHGLRKIIFGTSYSHLPVYRKSTNEWITKTDN